MAITEKNELYVQLFMLWKSVWWACVCVFYLLYTPIMWTLHLVSSPTSNLYYWPDNPRTNNHTHHCPALNLKHRISWRTNMVTFGDHELRRRGRWIWFVWSLSSNLKGPRGHTFTLSATVWKKKNPSELENCDDRGFSIDKQTKKQPIYLHQGFCAWMNIIECHATTTCTV